MANGLTLLAQPMPNVRSASFSLLMSSGAAADPLGQGGSANLVAEWVVRGAGSRNSRELSDYLDGLGLQRGQSAGRETTSFDGVLLGTELEAALTAYADIVLRPRLDATEFEQARELMLQEIEAMEDQPSAKWGRELWRNWWPFPFNRPVEGTAEELEALTPEAAAERCRAGFKPKGAILAAAGDVDFARLRDAAERLFGDWRGDAPGLPTGPDDRKRVSHVEQDTEQTHVGLVCDWVPFGHPDYYHASIATRVLSGGMGARLFTEVREKRALCYSVSASMGNLRGRGCLLAYANPEPPKAQEALDTLLAELRRLCRDGVTAEELERAKTGVKARLVMSGESSRARSGQLVGDWFHLGRVRPTGEIRSAIESITLEGLNAFLRAHPLKNFTVVTLGPKELKTSDID
jgi:predicted Zn-dependent peptidase